MLTIGACPRTLPWHDHVFDLLRRVELRTEVGSGQLGNRLIRRCGVGDTAEAVRPVAIDAPILHIESLSFDRLPLICRDGWRCRSLHRGKAGMDEVDQVGDLLLGNDPTPDRHVRVGGVRRQPCTMRDDAGELCRGQRGTQRVQCGHVWRYPAGAVHAVALATAKLHKIVRAGGDRWGDRRRRLSRRRGGCSTGATGRCLPPSSNRCPNR